MPKPVPVDPTITPTYVYDGECVLCSRAVRYVLRHDRSEPLVRFVAIKSAEGREIAAANNVDSDDPHTFIFVENGLAYGSSDALFVLARRVGGPWKLLRIFAVLPSPIRDWFYRRIAKNRYKVFGKLDNCFLPEPEHRQRFVLE